MADRRTRFALALVPALLAAACSTAPPPPLYQPRDATRTYGYFEQQVAPGRYRVGYSAPVERTAAYDSIERKRETDRLIDLSYDLAMLRAAQLATAAGRPAFELSERENNVQVDTRVEAYPYPGAIYPFGPYYRYGWYPYPYAYGPYAGGRDTFIGVEVQMTATLLDALRPGAFDARETLSRLLAKYPEAAPPYYPTAASGAPPAG